MAGGISFELYLVFWTAVIDLAGKALLAVVFARCKDVGFFYFLFTALDFSALGFYSEYFYHGFTPKI